MYRGTGDVASQWRHMRRDFCEMTSWPPTWKYDVISEIRLPHAMRIYSRNIPAKFHPERIRNDGAWGFLLAVAPTRTRTTRKTRWIATWDQVRDPKRRHRVLLLFTSLPNIKRQSWGSETAVLWQDWSQTGLGLGLGLILLVLLPTMLCPTRRCVTW